ncbi:MAG TPA: YraN family protein [Opitutales bacterium]|jgi:putative endonuclease|nr:YraN family protein [Opitutales bacterium]
MMPSRTRNTLGQTVTDLGRNATAKPSFVSQLSESVQSRWQWFWGLRGGPSTAASKSGQLGEDAAAQFARARGWKIVARNWRHGRDELDLVAWDGEVLVFAEVRARRASALVSGYHSVTVRKKQALARAIHAYRRGMAQPPAHFRFDIVEVKVSDGVVGEVLFHSNIPL